MSTSIDFLTSGLGMGIVSIVSLALASFSAYAGYRDLKKSIEKKNREKAAWVVRKATEAELKHQNDTEQLRQVELEIERQLKKKEAELQNAGQQEKEMERLRQIILEFEERVGQAKETETEDSYTNDMGWGDMVDTGPLPVLETCRALMIAGNEKNTVLTIYSEKKNAVTYSESKQEHHVSGTPGIHVDENPPKVRLK